MRRLLLLSFFTLPLLAQPAIDDLRFMAGHWAADGVEEVWLAPEANLMTGMNRTIRNGRASFEFFRIAVTPDGIIYFTQPGGRPAVPFKLIEVATNRAVFAKPDHDFPKRIIYFLRDAKLCARVEDEKGEGEEWCWAKVE
jgi:Domain of unknown function (DUF6265)